MEIKNKQQNGIFAQYYSRQGSGLHDPLPEGDPLQVVWAHLHGGLGVYPEVLLALRRHGGPGAQGAARRGRVSYTKAFVEQMCNVC